MTSGNAVGDYLTKSRMQMRIGGNDVAGIARVMSIGIGDKAAGLADQQNARSKIPTLQSKFPITVITAGGDPGEVERGGTEPTNAGDLGHKLRKGAGECEAARR